MARALTVCSVPGCPNTKPCAEHPSRKRSTRAWRALRLRVLQHDGFRCSCGAPAVEVDHVLARELGGVMSRETCARSARTATPSATLRDDAERSRLRPLDLRGRCRAPVFPPRCDLPNQSRARLVRVAHYEPRVHDTLRFRPRVVTTSTGEHCSAALGAHPRRGEVVLVVPCDRQVEVPQYGSSSGSTGPRISARAASSRCVPSTPTRL